MESENTPVHPHAASACMECGMVQEVPQLAQRERAHCVRCGSVIFDPAKASWSNRLCAASAAGALVLYWPAITLPILIVERLGHSKASSVWEGVVHFLKSGDYFVGSVVLICSIVIPVLKLAGLLYLVVSSGRAPHTRARIFRWVEWSGKWGMLDVLLIAILVAWVKMGDLVSIHPGPAVIAFCLMVFLSLVSAAYFDPKSIWKMKPLAFSPHNSNPTNPTSQA